MTAEKTEAVRLIKLALSRGWSQAELARQMGVTRAAINGVLKKKEPGRYFLALLREQVAKHFPDLLSRPDAACELRETPAEPFTRQDWDNLLEAMKDFSEEQRRNMLVHFSGLARMVKPAANSDQDGRADDAAVGVFELIANRAKAEVAAKRALEGSAKPHRASGEKPSAHHNPTGSKPPKASD